MKKNKIFKDSRPLEMLDYLDEAYVAEVVDNLNLQNEPGKPLPKKVVVLRSIRTAAVLVACAVLLGAAVPLVGRLVGMIPDILNPAGTVGESSTLEETETEPPVDEDLPEEYFTDAILFCGGGISFGAEYEGKWIHSSTVLASNVKFLAAYDPETGSTKSICVHHPNCFASGEHCPVIIPIGWNINFIEILGDWCMYQINGKGKYESEIHFYNMKTGESRVIADTESGNVITYPSTAYPMDGKAYLNMWDIDNASGTRRDYVSCYDPKTGTIEYLCEEPENLTTIGISNKRIFYTERISVSKDPAEIWSTDHSGGNLKKEDVLNFGAMVLSGTYAYDAVSIVKTLNTFRVYDFETNSVTTIDLGSEIRYLLATSSKLCFVFEEDGKVYISDPLGENRELVLDRPGLDFKPYDIVGDYIIGDIPLACDIMPGGTYALNIKTGELKAISEIN
ncbi:MAG: hypothetical protein J6S14_03525 [Clostridia bacterium]|nr:hypothetical protein [Clostridia bacterium]